MTTNHQVRRRKVGWTSLAVVGVALLITAWVVGPLPVRPGLAPDTPAEGTATLWRNAATMNPHLGVTVQESVPASDGTVARLVCFDFAVNPRLRLEIYDQDEDDEAPGDNRTRFWDRGVAQATRHLEQNKRGTVLAAWNGLFFATQEKRIAYHVGPTVLARKVFHVKQPAHRWTFGVKYGGRYPRFLAVHQPSAKTLSTQFDFAADAAQCLIQEGKPLRLQPFPKPGEPPAKQPVPSTPQEAGHIPIVDHLRTTRASLGWTRNGSKLYLLFVKEPDSETASIYAQQHNIPLAGGWTVADIQRFWRRMGVWGAINSDGGDLGQLLLRNSGGDYILVPPRWSSNQMQMALPSDLSGAPHGGSLMYFYVRDSGAN